MEVNLEVTAQRIYELKCWFDLNKGAMVKELNPEDFLFYNHYYYY